MTAPSLASIGLDRPGHRVAIWWLGVLYRRPRKLRDGLKDLPLRIALRAAGLILLHALPYIVLISTMARLLLVALDLPIAVASSGFWELSVVDHGLRIASGIAVGIALGIVWGIAAGIAVGIVWGISEGIAAGIAAGIAVGIVWGIVWGIAVGISEGIVWGIALGIVWGIAVGIVWGIVWGIASGIAVGIALGIVWGIAAGIAVGIVWGIAVGIASGIAAGSSLLRIYYHPVHLFFVWPVPRARWYPHHPVAWDDLCAVPFPGLDRLLVAYAEIDPAGARLEIERLISHYPSQRQAALRARTRLLVRGAGRQDVLSTLDGALSGLPEGDKGFLAQTREVRYLVAEIAAIQRRLDTMDRPLFREPFAGQLVKTIEIFRDRVGGFHEPLASELRVAAASWLIVAQREWDKAKAVVTREPTPQVFRAGDPVDRSREAFVPRNVVLGRLEQQLMLATGCPGLVLYGRRRMGKSTLVHNLQGFLPPSVRVASFSLQDPEAFTSVAHLAARVAGTVRSAWPKATKAPLPDTNPGDLPALFRFLSVCNETLVRARADYRLLLAVDEYEAIDQKIGEGTFTTDLLATLRESIQSHRQIVWLFAGSHAITELRHAPWTSYLVSARTVEVPPFSLEETRLLLTEPLQHSPLWTVGDPARPHFDANFWGGGGIERIHQEAAGWPHLVQLLAETAVDLLNDREARQLDDTLLQAAIEEAVTRGDTVLHQLLEGECTLPGEWDYLRGFRRSDAQPPPADEELRRALKRRLLVEEENGAWRLRVPLMQRWLRERR